MILYKTVKTLFTKPLILLMALLIYMLPLVLGALPEGGARKLMIETDTYQIIMLVVSIIMILIFIGPLAGYVYRVCNEQGSRGFFLNDIMKNTLSILIVLIITRAVTAIISGIGIFGAIYIGPQVLFIGTIAITFEAVAQVSIASGTNFTDAVDNAVSVTKTIYIQVTAISFLFNIMEFVLFSDVDVYHLGSSSFLIYNLLYGIFKAFTSAFVLVYCAHHFVEDKRLTDEAMERLKM
ncbi:MAG: hypothetical protein JXN65_03190 [Clostridia bacterium]|nr:hypothetical protein [Clostridia bacterium]